VHGDVVIEDRTVLGGDRFDMHNLESLVFEFDDSAREDVVGFALEFGSSAGGALFRCERGGIEAIRVRLTGGILGLEPNAAAVCGWSWNQRDGVTSTNTTIKITARS
jgi:hypothetical protein